MSSTRLEEGQAWPGHCQPSRWGLATAAALSGPAGAQVPNRSAPPGGAAATGAEADRIDGKGGCFYINQMQGDHALGDRSVLFRVNVSDIYRLDFAQQCTELTFPEPKLILTPAGGQGLICHAIDLDVKVGEQSRAPSRSPAYPPRSTS